MKIEKLSENQIRCTLNKADLTSRHLKISELAYGSEKAKELFRDMMKQAAYELGFEAEDIPLMIEAIPISSECIVLIVTKVDDPEELDTRFSKFSPFEENYDDEYDYPFDEYDSFGDIESFNADNSKLPTASDELDSSNESIENDMKSLLDKVNNYINNNSSSDNIIGSNMENNSDFLSFQDKAFNNKNDSHEYDENEEPVVRIFSFKDFDTFAEAARIILPVYTGKSSLYKSPNDNRYYLAIEKGKCSSINFNKACNMLSEYGTKENMTESSVGFFDEHWERIISGHAIQVGARL